MITMMIRSGKYQLEDIFKHTPEITREKIFVDFDGDSIKMNSDRYYLFKHKGCRCRCGLEGTVFIKEKSLNVDRFHFNLYGYKDDGTEVLFTKDHIIPKSKGGKNHFDNYQTMCKECNEEKSDTRNAAKLDNS